MYESDTSISLNSMIAKPVNCVRLSPTGIAMVNPAVVVRVYQVGQGIVAIGTELKLYV